MWEAAARSRQSGLTTKLVMTKMVRIKFVMAKLVMATLAVSVQVAACDNFILAADNLLFCCQAGWRLLNWQR